MQTIFEKEPRQQNNIKRLGDALDDGMFLHVRQSLGLLSAEDIGHILESMPHHHRLLIWDLIPEHRHGEVLNHVADEVRSVFLSRMQPSQVAAAVTGQDADDLADILADLPDNLYHQVLASMDEQDRQRVAEVLDFPEDSAGGMMNTDTVTVRPAVEVDVVLRYLRLKGELPQGTDLLYVVDRNDHLLGQISLAKLVTSAPMKLIADLMTESKAIPATLADSDVSHLFERYDWISAPVVNEQNQLLGRITIDDVVDVIIEDADQTMMNMAGLDEDEDIFAPAYKSAPKRALWLGINLMTALVAASVSNYFEDTIKQLATIAILMTIVPSMGGIAGNQTLTLIVRGIALDHIGESNARWLLGKEIMVGLLNGILWATVVGLVVFLWKGDLKLGLIIATAMTTNLLAAGAAGASVPLLLKKFGVDPAVAGGVVVTTITDVIGLFTFLGLATLFLVH